MEQIATNRKTYERAVRGLRKTSSFMKDYGIDDDFVANLFGNPDEVTNSQRFFMSRHSGLRSAVTEICPSTQREWYQLSNMRTYYELFYRFRKKFGYEEK